MPLPSLFQAILLLFVVKEFPSTTPNRREGAFRPTMMLTRQWLHSAGSIPSQHGLQCRLSAGFVFAAQWPHSSVQKRILD
eukprot:9123324-Karenia_brevis.AAC.1